MALALFFAPPALGTPLLPSPNPLPRSTFQGADGNQNDTATLIDWQGLSAEGRVGHTSDNNPQDTAFIGGSKEDEPDGWDFTIEEGGVQPPKANILDSWSAVDSGGADAFVYLGFARGGPDIGLRTGVRASTTFLTFELNHDSRLWDNGLAMIPCRRTGDILVSYEAVGGNNVGVDVVLPAVGHHADRSRNGVRHPRSSQRAQRTDSEHRRTGGRQRGHDPQPASRLLRGDDPDSAVRRGGAEPEPDPRRCAGQ